MAAKKKIHLHDEQFDGHLHAACGAAARAADVIFTNDYFEMVAKAYRCRRCARINWPHGGEPSHALTEHSPNDRHSHQQGRMTMTHFAPRPDAVWQYGRRFVPTAPDTVWVHDIDEFRAAGGVMNFNEDQTEIILTLPAGHKFGIGFGR